MPPNRDSPSSRRSSRRSPTLLTTLRAGVLRVGLLAVHRVRRHPDVVAGHPDDVQPGRAGRPYVRLREAAAVHLVRVRLIAFYESPIPGIGVSFSNLITDQAHDFANILDARSLELTFDHLDELWQQFVQPDAWSILANLLYWLLLIVVTLAKVVSLAVVAFGLIASAVCALRRPDLRAVLHRAEAGLCCSGRGSRRSSSTRSCPSWRSRS